MRGSMHGAERRTNDARRPGAVPALLVINGLLLGLLALVTFASPESSAQAQARVRGDYTMISGNVNGSNSAAIYIADTANQGLLAIYYDTNDRQLKGIGYRDLAADVRTVAQGPGR